MEQDQHLESRRLSKVNGRPNCRWPITAPCHWSARSVTAAPVVAMLLLALLVPAGQTAKPTPTASTTKPANASARATPSPGIAASPTIGPNGTPATIRTATAEIGHVVWAASLVPGTNAPKERVKSFSTDARTIYATIPIAWIKKGTTITATWSYNNTPIPGFSTSVTAPAEERELWVEFHLSQKTRTAWPSGTYQISIAIDGKEATTSSVVVGSAENS